jgi:ribokinase
MKDIAIVASCIMDLSYEVDRFPRPGETVTTSQFHTGFGGKGANQAVAAAKTDAQVRVLGAVGEDDFGRNTIDNFKHFGVDTRYLKTIENEGTGLACIMVDEKGENQIAIAPRANLKLAPQDVADIPEEWFEVGFISGVLEIDQSVLIEVFRRAKEINGARVVLNAAPAADISDELWELVDCLIVNETEAEFYTGIRPDEQNYSDSLSKFLEMGINRVILTLGSAGCVLFDREAQKLIEAEKTEAVDTTGAGDAFIGRYLSARAAGLSPGEAIARGNKYAALSVQSPGTQKSYPDRRG